METVQSYKYPCCGASLIFQNESLHCDSCGNDFELDAMRLCVVAGALLLPLILAYFMMHKKLCAMKTAVKEDNAANFMKPNSMNLDFSRDIFLYSTVTKTEKPKSDSGSHTSSSGRSHGGRGKSF